MPHSTQHKEEAREPSRLVRVTASQDLVLGPTAASQDILPLCYSMCYEAIYLYTSLVSIRITHRSVWIWVWYLVIVVGKGGADLGDGGHLALRQERVVAAVNQHPQPEQHTREKRRP